MRLGEVDVVEALPLEEDATARQFQLLDDAVDGGAAGHLDDLPRRDERGVAVGEHELVEIGVMPVAGRDALHEPVGLVEDDVRHRLRGRPPSSPPTR